MNGARCCLGRAALVAAAAVSLFGSRGPAAQSRSETALSRQVVRFETAPRLRESLIGGLEPASPQGWRDAWTLAARAGTAIEPMLWEAWRDEAHRTRRLLLVATAGVALDWDSERIAELLRSRRLDVEQRAVLAFGIAVAGRGNGGEAFHAAAVANGARQPRAVVVAAMFALGRLRDRPELAPRAFAERDAGLVAASCFCQPPPGGDLDKLLRTLPAAHRELVLRAYLLGEWRETDEGARQELARTLLRSGGTGDAVRAAAADSIGRALLHRPAEAETTVAELDRAGLLGDGRLVVAVGAAGRAAAEALSARGMLPPLPAEVHEGVLGRRLAALAVLGAAEPALPRFPEAWQTARPSRADLVRAGCLTLALRVWRSAGPPPDWAAPLADLDGGTWPWLALGGSVRAGHEAVDPDLAALLRLARAGRLPAGGAQAAFEDALWAQRAHPRQQHHELVVDLVVDVLLAGDKVVRARLGRPADEDVYLPRGLALRDHFDVAFELSRWILERAPRPPGERLLDRDPDRR